MLPSKRYEEFKLQEEKGENHVFQKKIREYEKHDDALDDTDSEKIVSGGRYHSVKYHQDYKRSLEKPEEFWAEVAESVMWYKPWTKVLDNSNPPFTKWFVGGELNACYNAVDRHVLAGRGAKTALIHDSPVTGVVRSVTYQELLDQVSRLAGALAECGVTKGDRVLIYMPLIPETIIAMLATCRLGAVHSVVFGGFAAPELCVRIEHAEPKVIIAASCGVEPNKIVRYKKILNNALSMAKAKPLKCIIFQRKEVEVAELDPTIDWQWDEAIAFGKPHECVPVEANEPFYILYTSGTTDKPKGVVRPLGGHVATLAWSMSAYYGMSREDVMWTCSDMGWVLGHSYICYGPLLYGATSIMYEGKPDRTPDAGQYFRVIENHRVNVIITAPTAMRLIRREDPETLIGRQYSTKSLKTLFVAGEHCDLETKSWTEKVFNVPVLNHWWQTETGHAITTHCLGLGQSSNPPKYTTGMPVPGYDLRILRPDGSEAECRELGRIAVRLPLPPGTLSTLYKAPERFKQTYFSTYPGFYDTMDAGFVDEHGYVYVTSRDDDVINVSGHRLCCSALEDVIQSHPDVSESAVFGVPEPTKGNIPFCLFVIRKGATKSEKEIRCELVQMVREEIGPIAAFHEAAAVASLPQTRSCKIPRKSFADLARSKNIKISPTIEDPTHYSEVIRALRRFGYAKNIPPSFNF